ncbi:Dehydration-responsive element-binding protein 1C [Capsicum baccatum]|uniref:Dehydration-responsive element-binding protein 1C n=1 Tax=Capsicum baccatum TaxID=33114 RepID=A0A2G2W301_CAPBA|nr:Dehydration-responsive element-binding protein 1C [Capsicum baccatum]
MTNNTSSCSSNLSSLSAAAASNEEGMLLLASSRPKKRAGRKKFRETRHPIYRGVRRRNNNKWVCELREPSEQKRIWLGTYPTPEMAARAHDVAALALRGNLATLNFADSSWRFPVPVSKDPKDIRLAAVIAAQGCSQDLELVGVDYMNHQEVNPISQEVKYLEDNETLEMQDWREKMSEGLLFSPTPRLGSYFSWDDVESDVEVSLWSYNIR